MGQRNTVYSYSRISTFETCPAQFSFRYIQRTPPPVPEGVELFLGSRFHETMEHLYREVQAGQTPTVESLLAYYRAICEEKWKEAARKAKQMGWNEPIRITRSNKDMRYYFERGERFIRNYYNRYYPFDQEETLELEYKVLFALDDQGCFKMQGFIDRLSRDKEGVLWIRDYKTSSRKHADGGSAEDQLALYQAGLAQDPRFRDVKKVRLAWHYVADSRDDLVTLEKTPGEIEELKKTYIQKIIRIETARDFPPTPSTLCGWCEYLDLCPAGQEFLKRRDAANAAVFEEEEEEEPRQGSCALSSSDASKEKTSLTVPHSSAPPVQIDLFSSGGS